MTTYSSDNHDLVEEAHVIIDEPFLKTVERLRKEEPEFFENLRREEQANVVRFGGCAILDSGASTGVTSLEAADAVQSQRLSTGEPGNPRDAPSDRRIRYRDRSSDSAVK